MVSEAEFAFRVERVYRWVLFEQARSTDTESERVFRTPEEAGGAARSFQEATWPDTDPKHHAPIIGEHGHDDGVEYQVWRNEDGTHHWWVLMDTRTRTELARSPTLADRWQRGDCEASIEDVKRNCEAPVNPGTFSGRL